MQGEMVEVRRDQVFPDPGQPRKTFDEEALVTLSLSIAENGLLQPISVRQVLDGTFLIIAGERRWRATGLLEWDDIPVIIRSDVTEAEAAKLQLLENIVREDLNPIDEARALQRFLDGGFPIEDVAKTLGTNAKWVSWKIQLLNCREDILAMVTSGQMSNGVAFELSKLDLNGQARALRVMMSDNLTHEELQSLVNNLLAEASQTDMFANVEKLTEEHKKAARTFNAAFEQLASILGRLDKIEQDNPGMLAEALAAEASVVEKKLLEAQRGLSRVQKALRSKRMRRKVREAA
jgi:ParB/RepB/Spo0J family partition protein